MVKIIKKEILLKKREIAFEKEGVFNPAVIESNGKIYLFYRAVGVNNFSTIGSCLLDTPTHVIARKGHPVIIPDNETDKHGIEDPRIVKIDEIFFMSYTSYDGVNALGSIATSDDLIVWIKRGIIVPKMTYEVFSNYINSNDFISEKYHRYNQFQGESHGKEGIYIWDKNIVFFPRRVDGYLTFLHRIRPDIQIVRIKELSDLTDIFWDDYFKRFDKHIVISSKFDHEISYVGAGCPPIETEFGWLLIYHSVFDTVEGYVYNTCAALLDLIDPSIEISRLPYPIFQPQENWELKGVVNNVTFPTGCIVKDDILYIYYGAADKRVGVASLSLSELLEELLIYKIQLG